MIEADLIIELLNVFDYCILDWPRRSGKTQTISKSIWNFARDNDNTNIVCLSDSISISFDVVRKTFDSLLDDNVIENKTMSEIKLINGSKISFKSILQPIPKPHVNMVYVHSHFKSKSTFDTTMSKLVTSFNTNKVRILLEDTDPIMFDNISKKSYVLFQKNLNDVQKIT